MDAGERLSQGTPGAPGTYRDAWGIPHLRADSALELAFAQGRNAAADRAWQLEVGRHRAQGTSAAFLGADALAWDRFARQARLEDTARRCSAALERRDPETAAWVRAYVDGVNAGLTEGASRTPEFAATGLVPGRWEPWTPLGVWLTVHILFAGFPAKLWREEVVRRLGAEAVGLFAADGPGTFGSNGWLVTGERTVDGRPHQRFCRVCAARAWAEAGGGRARCSQWEGDRAVDPAGLRGRARGGAA